jgi:S1-C subfamily serine protease
MARSALAACFILLIGLAQEESVGAQAIARLQSGVVKITAKPSSGTTSVGTGFIVRLETNAAYIVTAAHVVAGNPNPKVEFFTKQHVQFPAEVLPGAEGGDDLGGLALLLVEGKENLPSGIGALPLASTSLMLEDMVMIGFPLGAGPWHITKGNIGSRQGRTIYFDPRVESGNSGGPIIQKGKVVGVVMAARSSGQGITVRGVQDYIEGFGIAAQDRTSSAAMTTESSPPPAATAKPEPGP